jgi:rod shape determining protein RodA
MFHNKSIKSNRWHYQWKLIFNPWQQVDWWLYLLVASMTAFAVLMIHTTEVNRGNHWIQHSVIGAIGTLIAFLLARWHYRSLLNCYWIIYAITNIFLLVVIAMGVTANGAQSWISLGGFNAQPSEFAKLGVIITLAAILHQRSASKLSTVFLVLIVTALPWVLILMQPDLGTSLVFGAIVLGMLYWANANPGWLFLMISPLVSAILFNLFLPGWLVWTIAMVTIAWYTLPWHSFSALLALGVNLGAGKMGELLWSLLKPYQKDRLTLFLTPEKDPLGGGYHLIQSRIAIGSGEFWGRGLYHGTQTELKFIPEQHTDFIFSAVGEQLGFLGCAVVIIAFWLICLRLVLIACHAKDNFGSLLAIGVLSMIAFQAILNISMTLGIAPITGIPLPWLSYGGSSLLTNLVAIGIVESVSNFRPKKRKFFESYR